jgi:starch phosphorylase
MKALCNGVLNLSVLDGWWDEGYGPDYGWAIGSGEVEADQQMQDLTESQALYNLLEHQVVPKFYTRTPDGIPLAWCEMIRNSMRDLMPRFSSHRMVKEYWDRFYRQSSERFNALSANNFQAATSQADWCNQLRTGWSEVAVLGVQSEPDATKTVGESLTISGTVRLGQLKPEDVTVEVYFGTMDHQGEFMDRDVISMKPVRQTDQGSWAYEVTIDCQTPGRFGYTVRVMPSRERLGNPFVLGLVTWA